METPQPILFITTEKHTPRPNPALSNALARDGYQVMIVNVSEIENMVSRYAPALAIANLPGDPKLDLQFCYLLLRWITAPVMVISFLDDVDNRIAALDAGIADYLVSPISPLIIAARVRNILQRRLQNTTRQPKSISLCC